MVTKLPKKVKKEVKNKAKKKTKSTLLDSGSITSIKRLETMYSETETELEKLKPQIEKLEKQMAKLRTLKLTKQKLITLKLSLKSIIDNFTEDNASTENFLNSSQELRSFATGKIVSQQLSASDLASKLFLPDVAFTDVDQVLRKRTSLNYNIFRAIVFNGGRATTEQIKSYLVENQITQPTSNEGFENMGLTDISSRTNYLVRKGVVEPDGRGVFRSKLGWVDPEV